MPPIRRSNRVPKPKVHWEPRIDPQRRRKPPVFTIYTDPSEDLGSQFPEDLGSQSPEDLGSQFLKDLGSQPPEDLGSQPPEDLGSQPLEDVSYQPQFLSKNRAGKSQNLSEDS